MADAAAARREARRKRILENSHNRLQLISGKSSDECSIGSPVRTLSPDQDHEFPIPSDGSSLSTTPLNNGMIVTEQETFDLLSSALNHIHDISAAGDRDISELTSPTAHLAEPVDAQPSLFEKLTTHQYDLVVLSLILQVFYTVFTTIDSAYFFLPIIVYSVTKMIWFPTKSNSNIANMLMLVNSLSSSKVQNLIQIAQYIGAVSRDICIFLFTTICVQSLYITLKDSLIT